MATITANTRKVVTPTAGRATAIKQVVSQPKGLTSVSPPAIPKAPVPASTAPLPFEQRLQQAYSQYATQAPAIPTFDVTKQQQGIESMYAEQQKAQQERLAQQTATGVSALEQQRQKALPQYEGLKSQAEVQTEQSRRAMAEQLARQGLGASGQAVQRSATLEAGRVKSLADINTQQQQFVNDIDTQINALKQQGLSEQNAQVAELNARKQQALLDLDSKNQEMLLQTYQLQDTKQRQLLQDKVNVIEAEYKRQQDAIQQAYQNKQLSNQQQQQAIENAFKEKQFLFSKAMEEAQIKLQQQELGLKAQAQAQDYSVAMAKASKGGAGGGGGGAGGGGTPSKSAIGDLGGEILFNLEQESISTGVPMTTLVVRDKDKIKGSMGAKFLDSVYGRAKTVDKASATAKKTTTKPWEKPTTKATPPPPAKEEPSAWRKFLNLVGSSQIK